MKWLQWSNLDIEKSLGGVETHIRCLNRELRQLNVDAQISSNAEELHAGSWDVIHTHGSNFEILPELKARLKKRPQGSPVWVHTLHGLTHQRMLACGEYFWPGGYGAAGRELAASLGADVLLAIHPGLSLYDWLTKNIKPGAICGNGWDSWGGEEEKKIINPALPPDFWLFIGRGEDRVKGADFLRSAVDQIPNFKLVAVPGSGFKDKSQVLSLGAQVPAEIRATLSQAKGLILPSLHEGLPLVVLEALAVGVPVIATSVGGLKSLSPHLAGFFRLENQSVEALKETLLRAEISTTFGDRLSRAQQNRQYLKTWRDVAATSLEAVKKII